MIRIATVAAFALAFALCAEGLSLSMVAEKQPTTSSRRGFFTSAATTVGAVATAAFLQPTENAVAGPTIYNLSNGIKYAITQDVAKGSYPQEGDIIAIEYTGYLSNGAIFDATHSIGRKNALLFKLGR
jgi:FKBP-type peptidyl-prolyl cis-trans isomerase